MYTLDQLHAFVSVCECGSISAAARKLGKAQSGVSLSIANLEIELNQTLFDRSQNAVTLTGNGKALLPMAQGLLKELRYFEQKAEALGKGEEDRLVIALEDTLWDDDLMVVLTGLSQRFPHTNIELLLAHTAEIVPLLERGEIHIGLMYERHLPTVLSAKILGQQRFVTVASPAHPLSSLSEAAPAELARYHQITHKNADTPVISPQHWQVNSYYVMMDLVHHGVGWATLPEHLLADEHFPVELTRLNTTRTLSPPPFNIALVTALNHQAGRVTEYLAEGLAEIFGKR